MTFKDHFSGHARDYARFRPTYPDALLDWVAAAAPATRAAWDCACGNGQAAVRLAQRFTRVVATDASAEQIAAAVEGPANLDYRVATAEHCGLDDGCMDAICVAQALHWFDIERFYDEARRVAVPGALLATWMYGSLTVQGIDPQILLNFEHERVGPWWPVERAWIDAGYAQVALPGATVDAPAFAMSARWPLAAVLGYVGSWSAVARCRAQSGIDPLPELSAALTPQWGDAKRERTVRWPLVVRAARL